MKSKSIYKDHCIDYGLIYGPKMVQQKTKPLIPYGIQGFKGGLKQIRTAVDGFADRCLTARP